MCTLVILRRPGHQWPLIIAANRDEMAGRPSSPPDRHWPDRPQVTAGRDDLSGGTWLGINDYGLVAGVLNRVGSLGPRPEYRSRGELPLEALDHAEAAVAADALSNTNPAAFRSFNLVIADAREAFWLSSRGVEEETEEKREAGNGGPPPPGIHRVEMTPIPVGLSMITAHDLNDPASPRIGLYLDRFRKADPPSPGPTPDPAAWKAWTSLLSSRKSANPDDPTGAMTVVTEGEFGTVSSSLIALPQPSLGGIRTQWLFAAEAPGEVAYSPINI